MNSEFWQGKRVFLTGHTGFKGGWLALWLHKMGAYIYGYSLVPPTEPNLFTVARVNEVMTANIINDIRNTAEITDALKTSQAEIIFHLAAQPLVRYSYAEPVETYATNVMGTINLLEAIRVTPSVRVVVIITTDKCYENREWIWAYRENEPLGGYDPYSSSKACTEILVNAWRHSFFENSRVSIATARAGNVIGGGDWAKDRLIPDFFRSLDNRYTLKVRSPESVRPWQHVLEPLSGYLRLAQNLFTNGCNYAEAWNFGPLDYDARSVRWIIEHMKLTYPEANWEYDQSSQPYEAHYLKLDSSKARAYLGWLPRWRLETAIDKTIEWHSAWRQGKDMREITLAQINEYDETKPIL